MSIKRYSKKFVALSSALVVVTTGIVGGSVYANVDNPTKSIDFKMKDPSNLTEEEKTEMKSKRDEMDAKRKESEEKFKSLTDEQKDEIYSLKKENIKNEIKSIDKYLEFGVISEYEAKDMKAKLNDRLENIGNSDMPGFSHGRDFYKRPESKNTDATIEQ